MRIAIYDSTLTEGTREPGVQLSVRDKLRILLRLAEMGVAYVEGGWPGGGAAGGEVFRDARKLDLGRSLLCACAAVARGAKRGRSGEVRAAIGSGAPCITLSVPAAPGRSARGVPHELATAVRAVRAAGRTAVVELEDYFEAVRHGGRSASATVEAAVRSGAAAIMLADTSGGALPSEVEAGVLVARRAAGPTAVGVRARQDAGLAVANALAGVGKGATVVATTVNGYGDRCGAADMVAVVAALELKLGHRALAPGQLNRASSLAHFVADLADHDIPRSQPYVGRDAFVRAGAATPAHVDPESVGNRAEAAMADDRGHPGALRIARALGLPAGGEPAARRVLRQLAEWEERGFRYEGAEASFELLLRAVAGRRRPYFKILAYRVLDVRRESRGFTEATVEVSVGGEHLHTAALGVGPVHALDSALRRALEGHYPELGDMHLVQSRSRNIGSAVGTAGLVRVDLQSADARDRWGTAGISDNLLDACCQSLVDAIEYKLVKDDVPVSRRRARPVGSQRRP